jgi:hypothetical protein
MMAEKLTPEEQAKYDAERASPGILIGPDGTVLFDGEAEASGGVPFKTLAEIQAHQARIQKLILEMRAEREAEERAPGRVTGQ